MAGEKKSVAEAIAAGPPSAPPTQEGGGPRPIGVPETTTVPSSGPLGSTVDVPWWAERRVPTTADETRRGGPFHLAPAYDVQRVPPRYWTGDEWRPAGWDPRDVSELQIGLIQAGLLDAGEIRVGVFDEETKSAYEKLLGRANASGVTWEEALQAGIEAPEVPEPLQVKLTSPEDLRRVFRAAAFEVSATQFTSQQIDAMIASYHAAERTAQESEAAGDTTVFAPPDPSTFAMAEAEKVNPEGVIERRMQEAQDAWFDVLSGPVPEVA